MSCCFSWRLRLRPAAPKNWTRSRPSWSRPYRRASCRTRTRWGSGTPCDATTPCVKAPEAACAGTTRGSSRPKSSSSPRPRGARPWTPSPDMRPSSCWLHCSSWWEGGLRVSVYLLLWWNSFFFCFPPYLDLSPNNFTVNVTPCLQTWSSLVLILEWAVDFLQFSLTVKPVNTDRATTNQN